MTGEPCPACEGSLPRAATFCPRCGVDVDAQRARDRRAVEERDSRRTVVAIATVFVGTLGVLALAGWLDPEERGLQELLLAAVGLAGGLALGSGGLRASLASPPRLGGVLLGVAGGTLIYALSWAWVTLLPGEGEESGGNPLRELLVDAGLTALMEEWLCRGVLWIALRRALDTRATLFLSAILFAILHYWNGGAYLELPHRFAAGLVLGLLRARTGSLVPGIVAHFLNNAVAVLVG